MNEWGTANIPMTYVKPDHEIRLSVLNEVMLLADKNTPPDFILQRCQMLYDWVMNRQVVNKELRAPRDF